MEITGHSLSLQPKHPFALALKLTPELQRALLDAHKNGTAVKFRAEAGAKGALTVGVQVVLKLFSASGIASLLSTIHLSAMQAILTIANSRHRFNGYSTDNQKALFLTDDEDIEDGYVVANVTHKLHQQVSSLLAHLAHWGPHAAANWFRPLAYTGEYRYAALEPSPAQTLSAPTVQCSIGLLVMASNCALLAPPFVDDVVLQKSLPTSNISSKLRASAQEASRHKEGRQMQLLDAPVQLQSGPNGANPLIVVPPRV